ncbi:Rpn family recombination-promoting nuclease/putative transposase [Oceanobacillus sojae]|uniref:Rpn family recombination-promoting nuclease/putative transposase n=1 Tax=Oceanobacillus sojae TaxID=582851 RepID=UPI000988902E|nr:Rpn family recombination-promoting nuclease/putative transposase [Oceanobacillus sojae]
MLNTVKENQISYQEENPDYDGLWKKLIEELFQEFMQFFAPDLYPEINFKQEVNFENLELFQFVMKSKKGNNYSDKLVKVMLKNGEEKYVFIHIEVQAVGKKEFAERMFKYFYRIYDKSNHPIYSIALLTDTSYKQHEDAFYYSFYGTELTYVYNIYRFHGKDPEELKKSKNPFALAVLAGIYVSKNKGKKAKELKARFYYKQQLISLAFEKYSHRANYLVALLYFIDYMMQIPSDLQEQLYDSLPIAQNKKEEGKIMGLEKLRDTPTFGRLFREIEEEATRKGMEKGMQEGMEKGMEKGIEKGIEQGRIEAERNVAKQLLNRGYLDKEISELTGLELKEINDLRKSLEN